MTPSAAPSETPTDAPSGEPVDVPEGLYPKLLLAQETATAVEKKGENTGHKYHYAKAEDVIAEAQRALHVAKLVGFMRPGEVETTQIQSREGNGGIMATLKAELVIRDPDGAGDSPVELIVPAIGTGTDYPGDKAIYKAMTGAAKYAYSSALGIPFTDDPEQDNAGAGGARRPGGKEASPAQKSLLTRLFNKAGIDAEVKKATVFALAGQPVTMSGAGAILDVIAPLADEPDKLKSAIDQLIEQAGAGAQTAGLPGDEKAAAMAVEHPDTEPVGDIIGDPQGELVTPADDGPEANRKALDEANPAS